MCCFLAFAIYFASITSLETLRSLLENETGAKEYKPHSIRKSVTTFLSNGSTGGLQWLAFVYAVAGLWAECKTAIFVTKLLATSIWVVWLRDCHLTHLNLQSILRTLTVQTMRKLERLCKQGFHL
ncbi:hypothetical protein PHMEG_00030567 [Phytophthora megakarya]|uniref:Uncharacterized protein n=1 Tax=Phytophthora megakarya TaxID=4795 RepID=A0A225V084_9STRA|nr:hypothetical protein PHMEG_00030567 [Phytophthora megakarya]